MCDPVSLSIASTVVGVAGSAASAMGQASAAKKQAREIDIWQQRQKQNRAQEYERQEGMRQQAEAAQQKGLQDVSSDEQARRQAEEESRLESYLTGDAEASQANEEPGAGVSVADKNMLSGQEGGEPAFKTELAKKISEATAGAKQRLGALATVSSFGESFGGLGTENPLLQMASGQAIDQQNNFRKGSMSAYGVEQAVDPVQVTYTPSPLADIFSTALSAGAQGMGNAFGNPLIGSGKFPKAPKAVPFIGPPKPLGNQYAGTYGLF